MDYITLSELDKLIKEKESIKIQDMMLNFKDRWNKLIPELKKNKNVKLSGLNLKNADLSGIDLSNIIIEDSDFEDSDLSDSDLSNTVISGSNFSNSNMSNASLYSARITQTNFSNAKVYKIKLENTMMTGSVNLFSVYDNEQVYRTHPDITEDGFKTMEAMEHYGEDEKDNNPYY
jgi:hypothetical protein